MDLRKTYLVLEPDNSAMTVPVDERFWPDLMSGRPTSDGARLVANTRGRLMGAFEQKADWPHWERHPGGDEVLVLLEGRMTLILDEDDGERRVDLPTGGACVVPRGVWHRGLVREPGLLLAVTPGQGTEHRPV